MQRIAPTGRLALSVVLLIVLSQRGEADDVVNLLLDGGGESASIDKGHNSAWYPAFRPDQGVRLWIDHQNAWSGQSCFAIASEQQDRKPAANNWAQKLAYVPANKTVRVSAYVKTQDAEQVNVCVQCWGPGAEKMIGFSSTPVQRGTHDWTLTQSPELVVPAETEKLVVRAALTGKGKAFFDDISLEIVGGTTAADSEESNIKKLVEGRIKRTIDVTQDAMVLAYLPQWRHGDLDNIAVANNDGGVRTLMCWESPTKEEVAEAGLQFWLLLYVRKSHLQKDAPMMHLHEVEEPWLEAIGWTQQPRFRLQPTIEVPLSPGTGWKAINVTRFIRDRSETPSASHGVVLRFKDEDRQAKRNDWSGYQFVSREGIGQWERCRPVLLVVDPAQQPD
jgi:hypothetical protein